MPGQSSYRLKWWERIFVVGLLIVNALIVTLIVAAVVTSIVLALK